ncbi:MAG TPA: hypothetical protein VIX73_35625, partial [Kofleriaceae bacterium]
MAEPRRRRILRFFGPAGHLLIADVAGITMYEPSGDLRVRTTHEGILDVAVVGNELWALTPGRLTRLSVRDGEVLGSEAMEHLEPGGRVLQSSTAPQLPVWHSGQPVVLRIGPARVEVPGPGGELIFPVAENRWLLWQGGQLRLWRNTIGEAWRTQVGDPGTRAVDAQLLLDGRLFVLAQQRAAPASPDGAEVRLSIAQVADGAQNTQIRVPAVTQLAFAARRGFALARTGDRLSVFDLRFGRWIRDLLVPEGTIQLAVDDGLQRVALATSDGLELVRVEALAVSLPVARRTEHDEPDDTHAAHDATDHATRGAGRDRTTVADDAGSSDRRASDGDRAGAGDSALPGDRLAQRTEPAAAAPADPDGDMDINAAGNATDRASHASDACERSARVVGGGETGNAPVGVAGRGDAIPRVAPA